LCPDFRAHYFPTCLPLALSAGASPGSVGSWTTQTSLDSAFGIPPPPPPDYPHPDDLPDQPQSAGCGGSTGAGGGGGGGGGSRVGGGSNGGAAELSAGVGNLRLDGGEPGGGGGGGVVSSSRSFDSQQSGDSGSSAGHSTASAPPPPPGGDPEAGADKLLFVTCKVCGAKVGQTVEAIDAHDCTAKAEAEADSKAQKTGAGP